MSERLQQVILDRDLLAHARREQGEPRSVLVKVRGSSPRVELAGTDGRSPAGRRRPLSVSVPSPGARQADVDRLAATASAIEELCGDAPTSLSAARALVIELDPAGLRAVAELEDVVEIVPNRRHGPR